jgi:hypothetical protein
MTQPKYAPIMPKDQVRSAYPLATPSGWKADRPADFRPGPHPERPGLGVPGPDQGYALLLARRLEDRIVLADGEVEEDAVEGSVAVALRRASLFGRAPVLEDVRLGLSLFGFLGVAPPDLVAYRRALFRGASHHYWTRRSIAESVPEESLRLTSAAVADRLGEWKALIGESASPS